MSLSDYYPDKGHIWKRDEFGEVDTFAYSNEPHNGPKCLACGYYFCHHCKYEPDRECNPTARELYLREKEKKIKIGAIRIYALSSLLETLDDLQASDILSHIKKESVNPDDVTEKEIKMLRGVIENEIELLRIQTYE